MSYGSKKERGNMKIFENLIKYQKVFYLPIPNSRERIFHIASGVLHSWLVFYLTNRVTIDFKLNRIRDAKIPYILGIISYLALSTIVGLEKVQAEVSRRKREEMLRSMELRWVQDRRRGIPESAEG